MQRFERHHFIDNTWRAPIAEALIDVVDHSTGKVFAHLARGSAADIDVAVRSARQAFDAGAWGKLDVLMDNVLGELRINKPQVKACASALEALLKQIDALK